MLEMAGDAVGWMRRRGSRQSGLKLEAASAMGELESRTGLNSVSRNSDGGGVDSARGGRQRRYQRDALKMGPGSMIAMGRWDDDGVEGWLSATKEGALRLAVDGDPKSGSLSCRRKA